MATLQTRKYRENPPLRRPTEEEIQQAEQASRRLDLVMARPGANPLPTVRLLIVDGDGAEGDLEIPALAQALLEQILHELAQGNALALEPIRPLLSLDQAAMMLGVSRPFVAKLIEDGELACQVERDFQRVVLEDLMAFKKKLHKERSKILDELVSEAQELGLGY